MKKTNICVIGAGAWGVNHISSLLSLGVNVSCVDINKTKEKEIKKLFPHVNFFSSVSDTFEFGFDGYIVSTPPSTHCELAKIILSMRKPVLVEKPLALSFSEAKEIKSALIKNNGKLMVGHLLLFHPAIIKIKEMIKKNEIGKIQYVYSNRLNLGKVRKEENVFWSFAPHDISVFQYLSGSFPEKVSSKGSIFLQKDIHDTTITYLEYPNGIQGHIFVSWLHPFKEHRLVVVGTKGSLHFEDSPNKKLLFFKHVNNYELNNELVLKNKFSKEIKFESIQPLEKQLKHFLNMIEGNSEKRANIDKAIEVIKILESASKQLKSKTF